MDDFEGLFGFFMVIMAIVSAVSKQKAKKKTTMKQVFKEPAKPKAEQPQQPRMEQTMMEWFDVPRPEVEAPAPAEPAPIPEAPAAPAPVQAVVQPRVETRVAVHEQPTVIKGSLGEDTHEGIHPCDDHDDEPMQDLRPQRMRPVTKPGLQLDWTGENMVKAFVMQEVLTRPSQRRR